MLAMLTGLFSTLKAAGSSVTLIQHLDDSSVDKLLVLVLRGRVITTSHVHRRSPGASHSGRPACSSLIDLCLLEAAGVFQSKSPRNQTPLEAVSVCVQPRRSPVVLPPAQTCV